MYGHDLNFTSLVFTVWYKSTQSAQISNLRNYQTQTDFAIAMNQVVTKIPTMLHVKFQVSLHLLLIFWFAQN